MDTPEAAATAARAAVMTTLSGRDRWEFKEGMQGGCERAVCSLICSLYKKYPKIRLCCDSHILTLHNSGSAAGLSCLMIHYWRHRNWDLCALCNGVLVGFVAITGQCILGFVFSVCWSSCRDCGYEFLEYPVSDIHPPEAKYCVRVGGCRSYHSSTLHAHLSSTCMLSTLAQLVLMSLSLGQLFWTAAVPPLFLRWPLGSYSTSSRLMILFRPEPCMALGACLESSLSGFLQSR